MVIEAVLTASESIVTFRRRYRGRDRVEAVVELLVIDLHNPRSVAYQLQRMQTDLRAIPNTSPTARPLRLLDALVELVRSTGRPGRAGEGPSTAGATGPGRRSSPDLQAQLRELSEAIRDQYQQLPPMQQPMWASPWSGIGGVAMTELPDRAQYHVHLRRRT